jgi:hypothetical protein
MDYITVIFNASLFWAIPKNPRYERAALHVRFATRRFFAIAQNDVLFNHVVISTNLWGDRQGVRRNLIRFTCGTYKIFSLAIACHNPLKKLFSFALPRNSCPGSIEMTRWL